MRYHHRDHHLVRLVIHDALGELPHQLLLLREIGLVQRLVVQLVAFWSL